MRLSNAFSNGLGRKKAFRVGDNSEKVSSFCIFDLGKSGEVIVCIATKIIGDDLFCSYVRCIDISNGSMWNIFEFNSLLNFVVPSECKNHIYVGTNFGKILVFNVCNLHLLKKEKLLPTTFDICDSRYPDHVIVSNILPMSCTEVAVALNHGKSTEKPSLVKIVYISPSYTKIDSRTFQKENGGVFKTSKRIECMSRLYSKKRYFFIGGWTRYFGNRISLFDCDSRKLVKSFKQLHGTSVDTIFTEIVDGVEHFISGSSDGYIYCRKIDGSVLFKKNVGVKICGSYTLLPWLHVLCSQNGKLYLFSAKHEYFHEFQNQHKYNAKKNPFWGIKYQRGDRRIHLPTVKMFKGKIYLSYLGSNVLGVHVISGKLKEEILKEEERKIEISKSNGLERLKEEKEEKKEEVVVEGTRNRDQFFIKGLKGNDQLLELQEDIERKKKENEAFIKKLKEEDEERKIKEKEEKLKKIAMLRKLAEIRKRKEEEEERRRLEEIGNLKSMFNSVIQMENPESYNVFNPDEDLISTLETPIYSDNKANLFQTNEKQPVTVIPSTSKKKVQSPRVLRSHQLNNSENLDEIERREYINMSQTKDSPNFNFQPNEKVPSNFPENYENEKISKHGPLPQHEHFPIVEEYEKKILELERENKRLNLITEKQKRNGFVNQETKSQFISSEDLELKRLRNILQNKRFSDFRIYKRLGISKKKGFYGANCAVYLCGLEQTNDIFVMKIVFNYFNYSTNSVNIELVQKEYVNIPFHPNIAPCLYSFIDKVEYSKLPNFDVNVQLGQKTALFIFKYYPSTLENYIHQKNHELSDIDILLKLKQLIEGICHLKKHRICHRDLKPDNVFLEFYNSKCVIGDFGCCLKNKRFKFRFTEEMENGYSKGGAPYYLAPEILTCKGGEDNFINYSKNDIFSVGLIGCKMIQKEGILINDNTQIIEFKKGVKTDQRIINFLLKLVCPNPEKRLDCEIALLEIKKLIEEIICKK